MTTKGVIITAHNTLKINYWDMAVYTANRVKKFLDLPVTIISDIDSAKETEHNVVVIEADKNNIRGKEAWYNKGRFQVYEISPYDETLVIDSDYMINSNQLLKVFELPSDFVCHKFCEFVLNPTHKQLLSLKSLDVLWATVMRFRKTNFVKNMFQLMKMVQNNYEHYAYLHDFYSFSYRNDYALAIALHTMNGHVENNEHYLPWKLLHVNDSLKVHRISDTSYILENNSNKSDTKGNYIISNDIDFHMLSKANFIKLMNN